MLGTWTLPLHTSSATCTKHYVKSLLQSSTWYWQCALSKQRNNVKTLVNK